MDYIEPLCVIRRWTQLHPIDGQGTRKDLRVFVQKEFPRFNEEQTELAIDCLCAVGIGSEKEQEGTVYSRATR